MSIGINSENEQHRVLVKELVVDGKEYQPGGASIDVKPLVLAGTYAKDHEAIADKINEVIAALSK